MEIYNFETLESFLEFQLGTYYKFEALVRNTDGFNPLYQEGYSNKNKNILIKSWYVDSLDYYKKIKNEMITLCDLTGARLYVTLDRKSVKKTLITLFNQINNFVINSFSLSKEMFAKNITIKTLSKLMASCSSMVESSDIKTYMFDVDIIDSRLVDAIYNFIEYSTSNKIKIHLLNTKKGYHIVCEKCFAEKTWKEGVKNYLRPELHHLLEHVSLQKNSLGLIYMNKEEN